MQHIPALEFSEVEADPLIVQPYLLNPDGPGAVVLRNVTNTPEVVESYRRPLTKFLSSLGTPILVYERHGLWKPIGVKLGRGSDRVEGAGEIPPHIDLVNASIPPDFVMFYCEREDKNSGGASTVARFESALSTLDSFTRASLDEVWIREGAFFSLANVGVELSPFPLLEYLDGVLIRTRFTGKQTVEVVRGSFSAFEKFKNAMAEVATSFNLRSGSAFVVNQRISAHGREPLSLSQQSIPEGQSRLLWQVFISSTN